MNKQSLSKVLNQKFVKYLVIPLILFALWPILSFIFVPRQSLTTLSQKISIDKSHLPIKKFAETYQIKSEFKASYDNLGIVSIHQSIITDHLESTDKLLFRIKEKGQKNWYYENIYKEGFFNGQSYFPFGFPPIKNSKGEFYQFELISLSSVDEKDVSKSNPEYIAYYKYNPREILSSHELRIAILSNVIGNLTDPKFMAFSSLFLLPIFLYLLYLLRPRVLYVEDREFPRDLIFFGVIMLGITYDIIFIRTLIYGLLFGELLFLIIYYAKNRIPSQISILICFSFFLLSELFITFSQKARIDKASMWVYIFLCISLIQIFQGLKRRTELK